MKLQFTHITQNAIDVQLPGSDESIAELRRSTDTAEWHLHPDYCAERYSMDELDQLIRKLRELNELKT